MGCCCRSGNKPVIIIFVTFSHLQISYHTFPFDETESLVWLKNICAADKSHIELFPNSRVCSRHFTDDDYIPNLPNGRIRLKTGAVPTVFEWTTVNSKDTESMDSGMVMDNGNPAGFTVHVARKKPAIDDPSENDTAAFAAAKAIHANLSPPQTSGLDLTATSKAFIALQSPPKGLIAIPKSQTNSIDHTQMMDMESGDMDDDDDADDDDVLRVPAAEGSSMSQEDQCINCEILENELSRASIELTNLQREKVLLHAKCAELEDEVQKIHVYCKQLKALNGKFLCEIQVYCFRAEATMGGRLISQLKKNKNKFKNKNDFVSVL